MYKLAETIPALTTPPIVSACEYTALTLVNELVKGMLSVGPWLSPDNGSSGVIHPSSAPGH